jgi:Protein of unknown function (DUF2384)
MAPAAAMARALDSAEAKFDDVVKETERHVAPAQQRDFARAIASTRKEFARAIGESRQRLAHRLAPVQSARLRAPLNKPSLILSRTAKAFVPQPAPQLRLRLRGLNLTTETLDRRVELLAPQSEQSLLDTLKWMTERGEEEDSALLREAKTDQWSDEALQLAATAERRITERVLQQFFKISPAETQRLLNGVGAPDARERAADLRAIKESLVDLFEPDEIARWLRAPNQMFDGKTPLEAMADGQTRRIRRLLIRLEEGIPY